VKVNGDSSGNPNNVPVKANSAAHEEIHLGGNTRPCFSLQGAGVLHRAAEVIVVKSPLTPEKASRRRKVVLTPDNVNYLPKWVIEVSNLVMVVKMAVATCFICWSGLLAGQISGEFYLEKKVYAKREPVFLYFQAINKGPNAEKLYSADPNGDCSAFHISVSHDTPRPSCPRGVSCLSSSVVLGPGEKHVQRVLLNLVHKLDSHGEYTVKAEFAGPNRVGFSSISAEPATLHFRVDWHVAQREVFQPLLDQLRSSDLIKRIEAARALASVAPPFLEDTLLTFADDSHFRTFAALAFYRLNTPSSMAALAQLRDKTSPGTFEHWQAGAYLANDKCADAAWSH
jgi:hypothetical protein